MKPGIWISFILAAALFSGCRQDPVEQPPVKQDSEVKREITREVFDAEKDPALTAVGRINFIGLRWCSVTLVAEDIGITAGHCFLESKFKFDLNKDLNPYVTSVIFKRNGVERLEKIRIKQVLQAKMKPDYAIVRLSRKIPENEIKPLKISRLSFGEIRSRQEKLGCAGFNGDKELGSEGMLMTVSRNISIVSEMESNERIDTNCFSSEGGSGGLFFEERFNAETKTNELYFTGVVWGLTDGKYDERGVFIKDDTMITSITPVSVFDKELSEITGRR